MSRVASVPLAEHEAAGKVIQASLNLILSDQCEHTGHDPSCETCNCLADLEDAVEHYMELIGDGDGYRRGGG
jgi:tRNA U54 and U55 pseudouridine synthase Pus10